MAKVIAGAGISLSYNSGTDELTVASSGSSIIVQEGDVDVDTAAGTLDFDASDFNVTSSPAGEANIALNYGTGAGQPAEGNHTHAASLIVQEGDADVDTAVATIDFDASDFNITSSPAGEVNVALNYGTGAGQPAEGNHAHTATIGFSVNLGDGSNVITSSEPFVLVKIPTALTLTAWYIQADASGSIVCEVDRAANGTPTTFSSIAGTAKPTLSAAQSANDASLASWGDTTIDALDILKIYVSGTPSTVKRVAIHFVGTRSI